LVYLSEAETKNQQPKTNNQKLKMIAVAIIEDDQQLRTGLQSYLKNQPEFLCDIAVESVEDFMATDFQEILPDVIVLDIGLPGMSGVSGIPLIREKMPNVDIVMFTVYDDHNQIFQSLCAGATGYLLKATPLERIKEAIQSLHLGGSPMSPEIARKVIDRFIPHAPATRTSPLSEREKEVVIGLVEGLSYKMIADRLEISIDTVRQHIKNIYGKLHVHCKAEVISKSVRGEV